MVLSRASAVKKASQTPPKVALRNFASHEELLDEMENFRQKTLATPGAARQFLIGAGLLTKAGKPKQLIRG